MKRKPTPEPSIEPPGLEPWKALAGEKLTRPAMCVICGEECAPNSAEGLCWVCRRLKISAWRDTDHQMPAQE